MSGLVLTSQPEDDGCGERDSREEDLWAPVVSRCDPPPVLQPAEHDLDPIAAFVAALVIFDLLGSGLPARDARLYPRVFQGFSEPVGPRRFA